jgi:endoglucanase
MVNAWDDLSLAFNSYSNETLAYEIFNEPNFSSDSVWNVFANTMIGKIREREPERIIILGPNGDNSISKLTALSLPADKTNLIVSVHFYAPAALTHYNTGGLYGIFVQLNYPGQIFTSSALAELTQEERDKIKVHSGNFTIATQKTRLQPVLDFAATKNVRIRCGEYGCNNQYEIAYNDKDIKLRYFQDIVQVFDDLNIPHCVWGYKATFGLFNEAGELNDPRVVNAITGYDITTVSEYAVNSLPMKLYPVPSKTKEIISIETDFLQDAIIDMFNLSGVKIKSVELSEPVTKIVMPETPGVYLLVIKSENETVKSVKITVF